jgi:hypothetical protein
MSVGFPLVGTGEKNALFISFSSGSRAKLRTLPARELRRLLLLFKLFALLSEAFFLRVPARDGIGVSPCEAIEFDRCIVGPSTMELPRWLASHSSLKRLCSRALAAACDNGDDSIGFPGTVAKSVPALPIPSLVFGVDDNGYPPWST